MPMPVNIDELINGRTIEWERVSFLSVIHCHPDFINSPPNSGGESEKNMQVAGQVAQLLKICENERSRKELMELLHLKGRDNFEKLYLHPALDNKLIEKTIPEKPNSRLQKYRLTKKGKAEIQK